MRKKSDSNAPLSETVSKRKEFRDKSPKEGEQEQSDRTFIADTIKEGKYKRKYFIQVGASRKSTETKKEKRHNAPLLEDNQRRKRRATRPHLCQRRSKKENRRERNSFENRYS